MKKKHKVKVWMGLVMSCVFLMSAAAGTVSAESGEAESAGEGTERKAKIVIVSMVGNEITYYEVEEETETEEKEGTENAAETETEEVSETSAETEKPEEESTESSETEEMKSDAEKQSSDGTEGGMPDMSQFGGEGMPDMSQMSGGEMPDMSQFGGERPDMSQFGGERPDMSQMSGGEMPDMNSFGMESTTVYLPVSVVVHTDKGTEAGFTILEAGDEVEVLFVRDEDGSEVIAEIWM